MRLSTWWGTGTTGTTVWWNPGATGTTGRVCPTCYGINACRVLARGVLEGGWPDAGTAGTSRTAARLASLTYGCSSAVEAAATHGWSSPVPGTSSTAGADGFGASDSPGADVSPTATVLAIFTRKVPMLRCRATSPTQPLM